MMMMEMMAVVLKTMMYLSAWIPLPSKASAEEQSRITTAGLHTSCSVRLLHLCYSLVTVMSQRCYRYVARMPQRSHKCIAQEQQRDDLEIGHVCINTGRGSEVKTTEVGVIVVL
jgi:hypothetical protein